MGNSSNRTHALSVFFTPLSRTTFISSLNFIDVYKQFMVNFSFIVNSAQCSFSPCFMTGPTFILSRSNNDYTYNNVFYHFLVNNEKVERNRVSKKYASRGCELSNVIYLIMLLVLIFQIFPL